MFYLTTHSTHFLFTVIWRQAREETSCRHMGYSFRLRANVLLYAPSHRQDNTYHGLCYTSRGALAGTRNSSMCPPHEGSIRLFTFMFIVHEYQSRMTYIRFVGWKIIFTMFSCIISFYEWFYFHFICLCLVFFSFLLIVLLLLALFLLVGFFWGETVNLFVNRLNMSPLGDPSCKHCSITGMK